MVKQMPRGWQPDQAPNVSSHWVLGMCDGDRILELFTIPEAHTRNRKLKAMQKLFLLLSFWRYRGLRLGYGFGQEAQAGWQKAPGADYWGIAADGILAGSGVGCRKRLAPQGNLVEADSRPCFWGCTLGFGGHFKTLRSFFGRMQAHIAAMLGYVEVPFFWVRPNVSVQD